MNARIEGDEAGEGEPAPQDWSSDYLLEEHFSGISYATIADWIGISEQLAFDLVQDALAQRYDARE